MSSITSAEPTNFYFSGSVWKSGDYFGGGIFLSEKGAELKWSGVKGPSYLTFRDPSKVPSHDVDREFAITPPEFNRILRNVADNFEIYDEGPSGVIGSGLSISAGVLPELGSAPIETGYFHTSHKEQRAKQMESFIMDLKEWIDSLEGDEPTAADWEAARSFFVPLGRITDAYLETRSSIQRAYESGKALRVSDLPIPKAADDLPELALECADVIAACMNPETIATMLDHPRAPDSVLVRLHKFQRANGDWRADDQNYFSGVFPIPDTELPTALLPQTLDHALIDFVASGFRIKSSEIRSVDALFLQITEGGELEVGENEEDYYSRKLLGLTPEMKPRIAYLNGCRIPQQLLGAKDGEWPSVVLLDLGVEIDGDQAQVQFLMKGKTYGINLEKIDGLWRPDVRRFRADVRFVY
ncbi:MAG: hypothetical protein AAF585_27430 [Verrucomicrobiota bacterium]